jgi:hypothetical protein
MPVKSRCPKRRIDPAAELEAWSMLFRCGYDYFRDLEPYGFDGPEGEAAARIAAKKAWKRLGRAYMANFKPEPPREQPWALEEFGDPRCH